MDLGDYIFNLYLDSAQTFRMAWRRVNNETIFKQNILIMLYVFHIWFCVWCLPTSDFNLFYNISLARLVSSKANTSRCWRKHKGLQRGRQHNNFNLSVIDKLSLYFVYWMKGFCFPKCRPRPPPSGQWLYCSGHLA